MRLVGHGVGVGLLVGDRVGALLGSGVVGAFEGLEVVGAAVGGFEGEAVGTFVSKQLSGMTIAATPIMLEDLVLRQLNIVHVNLFDLGENVLALKRKPVHMYPFSRLSLAHSFAHSGIGSEMGAKNRVTFGSGFSAHLSTFPRAGLKEQLVPVPLMRRVT